MSNQTNNRIALAIAAALSLGLAAAPASAAVIPVVVTNNIGFTVSNSDLLHGLAGVVVGNINSKKACRAIPPAAPSRTVRSAALPSMAPQIRA